jgi:hypothetical protein
MKRVNPGEAAIAGSIFIGFLTTSRTCSAAMFFGLWPLLMHTADPDTGRIGSDDPNNLLNCRMHPLLFRALMRVTAPALRTGGHTTRRF